MEQGRVQLIANAYSTSSQLLIGWSTFASALFIRVPWPAARMTAAKGWISMVNWLLLRPRR